MTRAYRSMKSESNAVRPVLGDSSSKLGIRPVDLQERDGNAHPGEGGMSVVSSIAGFRRRIVKKKFSPEMLPVRMSDSGKIPGASGRNSLHVFRIGDGDFEAGSLNEVLLLQPDNDDHGTVQPAHVMPYNDYRQAIIDTRDQWVSGEEDE
jgi:hypothetical protein